MKPESGAPGRVLMMVENNSYPRDPRVRREAQALAAAGCTVCIVSPALPGQLWHETIGAVEVYRYPAPPLANGFLAYLYEYSYSMAALFILSFWIFLNRGFDVIHVANPPDTLVLIAAFYKLFGKRIIFDHHDLAPEMYYARFGGQGNHLVYAVLRWCEKISCQLADQIIATNQSYRNIEVKRDHVPAERITIVRNGPDQNTMHLADIDASLRNRAGTILAFAGSIGGHDGVDILLRSLHYLVYDLDHHDVLCVIVGDGDSLPDLRSLATQLRLDDYVWFTGWIDDPAVYMRYISTADICIEPTPSNEYNNACTTIKIMEYMALGKPIVAFDLPEHRYSAQSAACYAKPNDESDLARAVAGLIADPQRRQIMGAAGRNRIGKELAWQYSLPNLMEVYRRLFPRIPMQKCASQASD